MAGQLAQSFPRRFLRPVTWQGAPEEALPTELRESDPGIPPACPTVLDPQKVDKAMTDNLTATPSAEQLIGLV